jgi:hypothetical protein
MSSRYLLRPTLWVAPAFATVILVACGGRGPLDVDIDAYDAPDAAGLHPGDDGVEPKPDAGTGPIKPIDAGTGKMDAGVIGLPPGFPILGADAGGIAGCFGCAEEKCGTQVNACFGSPACVTEGTCGLGCLGGGLTGAGGLGGGLTGTGGLGGGLPGLGGSSSSGGTAGLGGGLNLQCLQACDKDPQANQDLFSAIECTFTSCSSECLGALGGAGGGGLGGLGGGLGGLGGGLGGLGGPRATDPAAGE